MKTRQTSLKFLILFKSLQFLTLVSRTVTSNDFAEIIQTDTRLDIMLGWNLGVKLYFKKHIFDLAKPLKLYQLNSSGNKFDATVALPAVKKVSSLFLSTPRHYA